MDEDGKNSDEPQHELLGRITNKLLEVCQIEYDFLSKDPCDARRQLQHASKVLQEGKPYFFIVKKGILQKLDLRVEHSGPSTMIRRIDALEKIAQVCNEAVILATTGKSGRELYEIGDRPNQLYMVGSMGCVSTLGLGMMLKSDKKIVCIDGDGALLMRLGSLAVNARYAKERNMGNFCHILLDNESHDSTGGQFGLSSNIDFKLIARASGYEFIEWVESLDELQKVLKEFMKLFNASPDTIEQLNSYNDDTILGFNISSSIIKPLFQSNKLFKTAFDLILTIHPEISCNITSSIKSGLAIIKGLDLNAFQEAMEFTLPKTGKKIRIKFQTPADLDAIQKETREFNEQNPESQLNQEYLITLAHIVDKVDGKKVADPILKNFLKNLPLMDTNIILQKAAKINDKVGIDTVINNKCSNSKCGAKYKTSFRITNEFFGPSID